MSSSLREEYFQNRKSPHRAASQTHYQTNMSSCLPFTFRLPLWSSSKSKNNQFQCNQPTTVHRRSDSALHHISLIPTSTPESSSFSSGRTGSYLHVEAELCHRNQSSQAQAELSTNVSNDRDHPGDVVLFDQKYEGNEDWHRKIMEWRTSPVLSFKSSKSKGSKSLGRATRARQDHNYCYYYNSPSSRSARRLR